MRNLSCTPLFSKLLESFVLEELRKETRLSANQYGGRKGISTDHFLIDTWNDILGAMEDGRAPVNLLSVDFEKALNRLDHQSCIDALKKAGASSQSIGLISAFLSGRTMSVKIGLEESTPRPVTGGSPQGSILANYLFCVTTDDLDEVATPDARQPVEEVSFEQNGNLIEIMPPMSLPPQQPLLRISDHHRQLQSPVPSS